MMVKRPQRSSSHDEVIRFKVPQWSLASMSRDSRYVRVQGFSFCECRYNLSFLFCMKANSWKLKLIWLLDSFSFLLCFLVWRSYFNLLSYLFCVLFSAWKSSSGRKIETKKRWRNDGWCWFCWLCWSTAWGAFYLINNCQKFLFFVDFLGLFHALHLFDV